MVFQLRRKIGLRTAQQPMPRVGQPSKIVGERGLIGLFQPRPCFCIERGCVTSQAGKYLTNVVPSVGKPFAQTTWSESWRAQEDQPMA